MGSHPRFAERRHRRNACSHLAERNSNLLPAAHRINPFPAYLREQLEEKLKERRVVVWYDLNREFAPFVEALIGDVDGHGLKQVILGTLKTGLSIFQGSYFALRMQLEASLSENRPKPLLIYLPGEKRDARGSVLMEWEKAGRGSED